MTLRGVAAAFDAIIAVALAQYLTSDQAHVAPGAILVLWGAAAAAVVGALAVLTGAAALLGWAAIGYVLFAAQVAPILALLAVAYMPLLPRPRGSLLLGLAVSIATAVVVTALVRARP